MTGGSPISRPNPAVPPAISSSVEGPVPECEWRLPSGEDLLSFALAAGLAAGPLLCPDQAEQEEELQGEDSSGGRS